MIILNSALTSINGANIEYDCSFAILIIVNAIFRIVFLDKG